jgi:hypothetical protein
MTIYGVRTNDPSRNVVKIEFKGFEISIAMDDGLRGRDLTRAMISVYKDDNDVTASLGLEKVTEDGLIDPTGEDLFKIMQAIERQKSVSSDASEPLSNTVSDARRI